ncbi:hypothetical protein Hanom_Chr15g01407481 [Helianthus anomalus]
MFDITVKVTMQLISVISVPLVKYRCQISAPILSAILTNITDISPIFDRYNRYITELLVLNCYIYKFCIILKLSISHRDNLYFKYRSLTDIRYFTALTA